MENLDNVSNSNDENNGNISNVILQNEEELGEIKGNNVSKNILEESEEVSFQNTTTNVFADQKISLENTNMKCKKKRQFFDSDSEDESIEKSAVEDCDTETAPKIQTAKNKLKFFDTDSENESEATIDKSRPEIPGKENEHKKTATHDTDSEEESSGKIVETNKEVTNFPSKKIHKRVAIQDSDSEDEPAITPHNKSFAVGVTIETAPVYNVDKKAELVPESSDTCSVQKSKLTTLCDSDSSDDDFGRREEAYNENLATIETNKNEIKKLEKHGKRVKKNVENAEKKMTGKQALEQRKEIRSESQRMLRESQVSLPYHKPKSRSLKEFLQKRPKFAEALPGNMSKTPPSIAIKMSNAQLELISKKLEEREKVIINEFYKSESETEEEQQESNAGNVAEMPNKVLDETSVLEHTASEKGQNTNTEEEITNHNQAVTEAIDSSETKTPSSVDGGKVEEQNKSVENTEVDVNKLKNSSLTIPSAFDNLEQTQNSKSTIEENSEMEAMEVTEEADTVLQDTSASSLNKENSIEFDFNLNDIDVDDERKNLINEDKGNNVSKQPEGAVLIETNKNLEGKISKINDLESTEENLQSRISNKEHAKSDVSGEEIKNSDVSSKLKNANETLEALGSDIEPVSKSSDERKLELLLEKYNFPSIEDDQNNEHVRIEEISDEPEISTEKLSKIDLLKQKLAHIQPRLSGGPDQVIDLEEGVAKPSVVSQLMERFIKHTTTKKTNKNKVQLNIISVTGGEIHKETVAMSVEPEEPISVTEKPGAKLQKLRNELQVQMAQRRSELWLQKQQTNPEENTFDGEKSECGADDDILDDEEFEMTDTDSSGNEEDVKLKPDKPRVKSAFIDEEAEDDDEENEGIETQDADDECDLDNDEGYPDEQQDQPSDDSDEEESKKEADLLIEDSKSSKPNEETTYVAFKKKTHKRIIKAIDDSDDEGSRQSTDSICNDRTNFEKNERNLDSRGSWDDDDILPAHQPVSDRTPRREMTQHKPDLSFLTPIAHLTGLQGSNSVSKFLHDSPLISPFQLPPEPSPLRTRTMGLQKNLFAESEDLPDTQAQLEELADICSGKFPSQTQAFPNGEVPTVCVEQSQPSTQDLLELCSGGFETTSKTLDGQKSLSEEPDTASENANKRNGCSQDDVGTKLNQFVDDAGSEIKNLGCENEDRLISQLLDEEEMNQFKKKFDTPLKTTQMENEGFTQTNVGRILYDSMDEDEDNDLQNKKKRKAKIVYSDDDSDVAEENDDEEIDLNNMNSEDEMAAEVAIGYDSEENEIELNVDRPKKMKIGEFFENEAELSESEWGSDDEDERDLNRFEAEAGDADVFDAREVRRDLEKIHMRQILDEDNREVKILQELLLEDGELHGAGRQRQFRWKNIDSAGNDLEEQKDDAESYLDEEESEEQWRKKRYEREIFLKSQQEKSQHLEDDEDVTVLHSSQVLKLGQKAIIKNSNSQTYTPTEKPTTGPTSPDVKLPFALKHKRGSFLTRNDKVLQRLAEFSTKIADTNNVTGVPKNSRNFVFQTVSCASLATEATILKFDKKRKASDGTPKVIKKLRLTNNFSPAANKTVGKNAGKKLFALK